MYKSLNGPAIGIKLPLPSLIRLAKKTGFSGVDFDMREARLTLHVKRIFDDNGIRPAQWGLPVIGPQSEWQVDRKELTACAKLAASLQSPRCATWVPSWSDSRDMETNIAFHIKKLTPVAQILADHGCQLGLEFLGPATLFAPHPYSFIHRMEPMIHMAREIGPNVGLLLDAWHLFTSGGTVEDLSHLRAADIVHVHINDAPVGVPFDQVMDNVRHLPLETGVLDLPGFMKALSKLGYDGPVTTEPFNARLNAVADTDPEAAASEVSTAMDRLWQLAGLS